LDIFTKTLVGEEKGFQYFDNCIPWYAEIESGLINIAKLQHNGISFFKKGIIIESIFHSGSRIINGYRINGAIHHLVINTEFNPGKNGPLFTLVK